jgi:hypothetical protein
MSATADKLITTFNSHVSWIINLVRKLHPKDANIDRAAGRISIAKQADPTILINIIGPSLVEHRDKIINYDDEFVLTMDISKHTDDELVIVIFETLTASYKGFKDKERDVIKDRVNDMLNTYMEYLIAIQ